MVSSVADRYNYFHVQFTVKGESEEEYILGLSYDELFDRYLTPRAEGVPVVANGRPLDWADVKSVAITASVESGEELLRQAEYEESSDVNFIYVGSANYTKYLAWDKGDNVTNQLITSVPGSVVGVAKPSFDFELDRLLEKFHSVAMRLRTRHDSRSTIEIKDEYDVQDLMWSLLTLVTDDIRKEDVASSYAGKTSRIDFVCKQHGLAIEIKKTRNGLKDKELGDELLIDIARYKKYPGIRKLACYIYDPGHLVNNPSGLEQDLNGVHDGLEVQVVVRPKS